MLPRDFLIDLIYGSVLLYWLKINSYQFPCSAERQQEEQEQGKTILHQV